MSRLTEKAIPKAGYIAKYKATEDFADWECIDKLGHLEDAEEKGLLLRLPCKIGDLVYRVLCSNDNFKCYVFEVEVYEIVMYGSGMFFRCIDAPGFSIRDFGKSVFATKAEAEAALQAVEQKEGGK